MAWLFRVAPAMDGSSGDISRVRTGDSVGPIARRDVARALSHQQFAELYVSAYRTLWCIASAVTGNRSKAGDVVQEASVIALSKLGDFDPGTSFVAWMAQIVRFVALNEGRRAQRERANLDRLAQERDPGYATLEVPAMDPRVESALAELDEVVRLCVVLRTVSDMGYKEISQALGIPEGTAMSHVFRARKVLREKLKSMNPLGEASASGGAA